MTMQPAGTTTTNNTRISVARVRFSRLIEPLIGLPVSLPWKGYGSAIFLELGQLTPSEPKYRNHADGEASIAVQWDWRVEHQSSVLYGSSNSRPVVEHGLAALKGALIEHLFIAGEVPELTISFSNGHILRTMVMVTGDPEWSIKLPDGRWLRARANELLLGDGAAILSEEEQRAFAFADDTAARWGVPLANPASGQCRQCDHFVWLDGNGHMLDYGVCTSSASPFDGRAVKCTSGCPAHVANADS